MKKIALELYSLKDVIGMDIDGAFGKLAAMGYDGVEFAGFYGLDAVEIKRLLHKHGLVPFSSHVGKELLQQDTDQLVAYHQAVGCPALVVPSAPFESVNSIGKFASFMENKAAALWKQGLRLGYHNHSHEFRRFDGRLGLDLFFEQAPPCGNAAGHLLVFPRRHTDHRISAASSVCLHHAAYQGYEMGRRAGCHDPCRRG